MAAWSTPGGRQRGSGQLRDEITFELYVSTHDSTAPEKPQTDLYLPIA